MLIALDIGNSHVAIGGFHGDDILFVASMATDDRQSGEQYACGLKSIFALHGADSEPIEGAVLSSVVPSMIPVMRRALSFLSSCRVLTIGTGVKTGLNIKVDQPRTLGTDRVAAAVWASQTAALPCVIVDFGTAITFTALDANGALVGSAIAPGMHIALHALGHAAAQLPEVRLDTPPKTVLGRATTEAIQIGSVYGTAAMVDGLLARFAEELSAQPEVLLSGSSAALIQPYLRTPARLDPQLVLRGLALIWRRNQKQ